jgi:hypothetical protein
MADKEMVEATQPDVDQAESSGLEEIKSNIAGLTMSTATETKEGPIQGQEENVPESQEKEEEPDPQRTGKGQKRKLEDETEQSSGPEVAVVQKPFTLMVYTDETCTSGLPMDSAWALNLIRKQLTNQRIAYFSVQEPTVVRICALLMGENQHVKYNWALTVHDLSKCQVEELMVIHNGQALKQIIVKGNLSQSRLFGMSIRKLLPGNYRLFIDTPGNIANKFDLATMFSVDFRVPRPEGLGLATAVPGFVAEKDCVLIASEHNAGVDADQQAVKLMNAMMPGSVVYKKRRLMPLSVDMLRSCQKAILCIVSHWSDETIGKLCRELEGEARKAHVLSDCVCERVHQIGSYQDFDYETYKSQLEVESASEAK